MDALGLADGIKSLNAAAIKSLVTSVGGEMTSDVHNIIKGAPLLSSIAAVGTVIDGLDTVVAFSDGEITNDDWIQLGQTIIGVASFIPGPIGLIATGISVGMAIYDIQR